MAEVEEQLRAALEELDRFRRQEAASRRENYSVSQALQVLADDEADGKLPARMLNRLRDFFELDEAAIIFEQEPLDFGAFPSGVDLIQTCPAEADFSCWPELPSFPDLLGGEPRIIGSSAGIPGLDARTICEGSFLLGGLQLPDMRALLVLFRSARRAVFTQDDVLLFRRLVPIVEQALKRQKHGALRDRLEIEMRDRQKMESLGTLAGGVAHEINTPLQYVLNNLSYLADASGKLLDYSKTLHGLMEAGDRDSDALAEMARSKWTEIDGDFLAADLPDALEQSITGMERIGKIVQAIREFSHPAGDYDGQIDIDREIRNALTVSKNQWKYVADVEMDLEAALPVIQGASDDLRQVLINLLVNATHAIEDRMEAGNGERGRIEVSARVNGRSVVISISDNGIGMSEAVRKRAFDPFYTTKAPGRGTGQGLALCYAMIVQNMGGRIDIDSERGTGTTFHLRLPLDRMTPMVP